MQWRVNAVLFAIYHVTTNIWLHPQCLLLIYFSVLFMVVPQTRTELFLMQIHTIGHRTNALELIYIPNTFWFISLKHHIVLLFSIAPFRFWWPCASSLQHRRCFFFEPQKQLYTVIIPLVLLCCYALVFS